MTYWPHEDRQNRNDMRNEPPPQTPQEAAAQIVYMLRQVRNAIYYAMFWAAILTVILVYTA